MKRAARAIALLAIGLAIVTARVLWSARIEWSDAEAKLAAGDGERAVDHFGRAARLYAPGNPWSSRSLDRLEEIARRAERAGDRDAALVAWREIRSSVLATRAVYSPNDARRAEADARIAALAAALESPALDPGSDEQARRLWHAERLAKTDEPAVGWTLLLLIGFAGFVGGAIGFLLGAVDEHDRLRGGPALAWAVGVCAGMTLFVLGLSHA